MLFVVNFIDQLFRRKIFQFRRYVIISRYWKVEDGFFMIFKVGLRFKIFEIYIEMQIQVQIVKYMYIKIINLVKY